MNKTLLIIVSALLLCSCEPSSVRQGRKLYEKYYKSILKDPESFKVYNEKYTRSGRYEVDWTIDYGARNSYGGMVRKTAHIKTVGGSIFVNDHYVGTENDLD